jgi:hydrogenase maturation protease
MTQPRILVAGVGNIFLGDDAFGVEVVQRLAGRSWPECVRVVDFGIRGLDLVYALLEGYEAVILVDAVPCGGPPGTLYLIEPEATDAGEAGAAGTLVEAHDLSPVKVLRLVRELGGQIGRLLVVGCEPSPLDSEDMAMGVSPAVRDSVDDAVRLVESLIQRALDDGPQLAACAANDSMQ